jgi:hypothetical protein
LPQEILRSDADVLGREVQPIQTRADKGGRRVKNGRIFVDVLYIFDKILLAG